MQGRQKQRIETYQRVQVFLTENPLTSPATYGAASALLDDVVAQLTAHLGTQAAASRLTLAESERQRTLRRTLREQHLVPIARIANAVLRGSPGIDKATRLPAPYVTTTKLLAEAVAFRETATPYAETFVHHGLAADFLTQLDAAIEELREVQQGQERTIDRKNGAHAGIATEVARGRQAVQMLDAIVKARFAGNGEVLTKWQRARRVKNLTSGGTSSAEPSVQPPVQSPVPQSISAAAPAEPKAA